jgi:hypothetical protein
MPGYLSFELVQFFLKGIEISADRCPWDTRKFFFYRVFGVQVRYPIR